MHIIKFEFNFLWVTTDVRIHNSLYSVEPADLDDFINLKL